MLLLAAFFWLASPASAQSARDQLCGAVGLSSGCIGDFEPSGGSSESREPTCGEECRRQAAEDRRYALENMKQPSPVLLLDPLQWRHNQSVKARLEQREEKRVQLASVAILVGTSGASLGWAPAVVVVGAAIAIVYPEAYIWLFSRMLALSRAITDPNDCPEAMAADCAAVPECGGSEDCNESRRRRDKAAQCWQSRLSDLRRCNAGGQGDVSLRRYQTALKDCKELFDRQAKPYQVHLRCDQQGTIICKDLDPTSVADCVLIRARRPLIEACYKARESISRDCYDGAEPGGHPGETATRRAHWEDCVAKEKACAQTTP